MKKALLLLLLLIIAGTVFFFGWIQILIPKDHYAVIFTKTRGYDDTVYEPGTFYWKAERLIPGNLQLSLFDCTPRHKTVRSSGTLPSGEIYASILGSEVSFKYEIELHLSYRIPPSILPDLHKNEGLEPDDLDQWYTVQEQALSRAAMELLSDAKEPGKTDTELRAALDSRIESLEILSAELSSFSLPDIELYHFAKEQYMESLRQKQQQEKQAQSAETSYLISKQAKLSILEEYGRLLSEYPGLLQLLMADPEQSGIEIPNIKTLLED